jgi:formylglycine-generating enzyme required for sulfatase activity
MSLWPPELAQRAPLHDFPPAWASAWGDDRYGLWADLVVGGVTQRLRWIEPSMGEGFLMGSTQQERNNIQDKYLRKWANQHETEPQRVVIQHGFWLADTPCTQAFWLAVEGGENPSRFKEGADALRRPVEQVPFDDDKNGPGVSGFLQALNQRLPEPRAALPSEEQWEYACRADSATVYWWGDDFDPARANVNHTDQKNLGDKDGTTPVDRYLPNPWGLYDMNGNVWEWTASPWRERDAAPGQDNPWVRVVRGGSWLNHPCRARSASRGWGDGDGYAHRLGFRFLLRSSSPGSEGLA